MTRLKTGIVIGSYNMPDVIRLQFACIRHNCGPDVPILISDDCSDGVEPTPNPASFFGRLVDLAHRSPNCYLWPNVDRIGHAGGDMAAFWKGIVWGGMTGLDVVFKLSQRYVIDVPNWDQNSARLLLDSGLSTLGRRCAFHGFDLRTEAVGMRIDRWHRPDILAHLTPRRVAWAAEGVLWDDVRDRLEGRLCEWPLMSPARPHAAPGVLFRESNAPREYADLAERLGLGRLNFETRDSNQLPNYALG